MGWFAGEFTKVTEEHQTLEGRPITENRALKQQKEII